MLEPDADYRPLSGLAVAGLVLALLSPLAFVDPLLWVVPLAALLLSGLAWRRIAARWPALSGRGIALAGFALSLGMTAAAPADFFVYRWMLRREAREFALQWFALLAANEPQKAYQLTQHPASRQPFDEDLDAYYRDPHWQAELDNYVKHAPIDKLLALGSKAEIRYCYTAAQSREGRAERVEQVFAVSYDDRGGKETVYLLLRLSRYTLSGHRANWRVDRAEALKEG